MPSGKQTSFQYGEISPVNHYRSNDAEYSSALHSLYNMTVKRAGGVRKIPGSKLLSINGHYDNAPLGEISYQRYKIFPYTFETVGVRRIGLYSLHIEDDAFDDIVTLRISSTVTSAYRVTSGDGLAGVKSTFMKDTIFIHGLKILDSGSYRYALIKIKNLELASPVVSVELAPPLPAFTAPSSKGSLNLVTTTIFSGVQYLITAEFTDGIEYPFKRMQSSGTDANGFMAFNAADHVNPGDGVLTGFRTIITMTAYAAERLKNFKIYRSTMTGTTTTVGNMALVANIPADTSWITLPTGGSYFFTVNFNDSGASVVSSTPPIDTSLFVNYGALHFLEGNSCSCEYQERQIVGFNIFNNPKILPGGMAVTAIGSSEQFARPIISSNVGAFGMSIPTSDGSPVRALIAVERLIAFSDRGTYVIQGGENGILTPTSINPIKISSEGTSKYVEPLIVGRNVIYLNTTHTKIMSVVFGQQYQAAAVELAKLSDHLFMGDKFIEMAILPGADDVVLLLKQSGELIAVAINEEGVAGPSVVNMEGGKVETMTSTGKVNAPYLTLSVIRNGIRTFESIADDSGVNSYRTQAWTNTSVQLGIRLLDITELGYPRIPNRSDTDLAPELSITYSYLNITTGTDYNAGSTLTITSVDEIGAGFTVYDKIKCYYLDDEGEERYLYLTLLDAGVNTPPWTYTARADIDVPTYLQDVEGNGALSAQEKLIRTSKWLPVTTRISASGSDFLDLRALYLLLKDGASVDPTVMPDGEVDVAIYADDKVYSSPLNPHMNTLKLVKEAGVPNPYIDFPEPVAFAMIGVPYESYMQTLPIEVGEGRTLTDDKKLVDKVGMAVFNTVGGFAGMPGKSLREMAPIKTRDDLDMANPDMGLSGYVAPSIPSEWTKDGMIKIIQVDPAPMTVLSVYPKGVAGD